MDLRPPRDFSNCKSCPGEPSRMPNPMNFHHQQFLQHPSFSQPPYAMNFPHQQFPQQHLCPQNVHYVVVQPQYTPFSLPHPPAGAMTTPPPPPAGTMPLPAVPLPPPPAGVVPFISASYSGTPHSVTDPDEQDVVSVDNDDNVKPDRTARRLNWTEMEDLRLISAWLNSSKLSNSKKNEAHWGNVAEVYNSSTPKNRRRAPKQLKPHWQKINKKIAHFYDCWCRVEAKYSSVQSDHMQLMDKTWAMYCEEANAMYLGEAKHNFTFSHLWKAVWDQPKWKNYISSLYSKRNELSEFGDCMSSSEDVTDVPEKETGEQGSMPAKKKREGESKVSSPSSELQEDIQCLVDPQNKLEKKHEEMTEVQLRPSGQKLELSGWNQLEMKDKGTVISEKQTDLLTADTLRLHEFQHGKEKLIAGTSRFNEFHHGSAVREDVPEKNSHPHSYKVLENERAVRGSLPEKETHTQGSKMVKGKRKRKGNASSPSSEVQDDIKCVVDLQTMLQKDREKMSEVQLHLSKEKLELARLKQQEAKDKKETTLYKKYTELLMADTQMFSEFQKEEYQKAVKRMGEMLFGKDGK
ncbi:uncharacterized protein LOC133900554 [Phragmites australis]|uniref:uncharacterized protein LOC133900554 n=1 Tax=Phragmites australis TaxID=29695 RepID=UPI002D78A561|nr:uncharacterized protein LOC133900554 [Phragmites australis]XP_062197715.1 uncharacterized protein LOC133900554 [Phragmites australis]